MLFYGFMCVYFCAASWVINDDDDDDDDDDNPVICLSVRLYVCNADTLCIVALCRVGVQDLFVRSDIFAVLFSHKTHRK